MIPSIRRYYDQNTRLFLKLGSAPGARAIHRALWPDGVHDLEAALHVTNHLILTQALDLIARAGLSSLTLADLGCGVSGTLLFLLERLPASTRALGVTISPVQAGLGGQSVRQAGRGASCLISAADFQALPASASAVSLAYAVEAAVHAPDPGCFYREAARVLRPGGRLALVDDFLNAQAPPVGERSRWLEAYQSGWHTPGLLAPAQAEALAAQNGLRLVENRDLTPLLKIRALPNRLAALLLAVGRRLPIRHAILPSMLGSLALQQCLRSGWLSYRLLVFEKRS